ncbi:MAG TPA: hypothetical protein VEV41_27185 [Terriglobales bacterium]|nr:hypothetical protein [Terriglobales bacterium]
MESAEDISAYRPVVRRNSIRMAQTTEKSGFPVDSIIPAIDRGIGLFLVLPLQGCGYNPVGMLRLRTSILTRLSAVELFGDLFRFVNAVVHSQRSLVAENLFLPKQLAFYQEREVRPRRLTDAARLMLVLWSRTV